MKKITYYKHMRNFDEQRGGYYAGQGKDRFGYHFEQAQGYLFECPNGIQFALEKIGSFWNVTELTSGNSIAVYCYTRAEAIEKACAVADAVKNMLDKKDEYITANIKALRAYAEQQQRLTA